MDEDPLSETQVFSVLVHKPIYASSVDLNKKRKLEDDQADFPSPKHKCGDPASEQDAGVSEHGMKQLESPNGSNYYNSAAAVSSYPEAKVEPNFLKVYTYNKPAKFENVFPKTHIYDQPSTSYGSCGSNSFKSIDEAATSIREDNSTINKEFGGEILKDGLRFEENELPGSEKNTDCIDSEYDMREIEECSDNYMNLDSNEAESNLFVLSSGRWDINHDSQVDTRKPTIDQEFEHVLVHKPIYASSVDLNKKRKLEDDQADFPSPKHKCGDPASEQDAGVSEHGMIQLESPNGSNYYNSVAAVSSYPEAKVEPNFLKVYTYNKPAKFENVFPKTHIYDQPSTSYGSCGSNSFKSIDEAATSIREDNSTINKEFGGEILKDGLRFEEDELPGFEKNTDCIDSEYDMREMEECSNMEDSYMNLDSNEAESNLFVLSSGRWDINHDSQVDTRKPTIDQEFEQYFSMIML